MQRPSTHHTTDSSKVEPTEFCLIHHIHLTSHQPTTTSSSIKQLFAGKTLPQLAGSRKIFPSISQISKYGFLCYESRQTFLVGKNVLIVMVPILTNKDVFEPSYNDLKFTV